MEQLKKDMNEKGHSLITIRTNEGAFTLSFDNKNDLYIAVYPKKDNDSEDINFTITREDYYLFSFVDKLFKNIKQSSAENEIKEDYGEFYIKSIVPFENNQIRWISDDFENEKGSELIVSYVEKEDSYKFTFKKSRSNVLHNTYFVKINTIGSYYHPYNDNFVEFYQDLLSYDYEYHQIHMDEYLYSQDKTRIRK